MNAISVAILEEIGLEGLDGITFEALWGRLEKRGCFYNHENFFSMTWSHILKHDFIQFYRLPQPRSNIRIVDRTDMEEMEANGQIDDFYTLKNGQAINQDGVMGVCMFYHERREIPREKLWDKSYPEVILEFGTSLILVASQEFRESLIFPANLEKPRDIPVSMYGLLELIGRSRFRGETTNGTSAILTFIKDHQTIFYMKKKLVRLGLLTQQLYCRYTPNQGLLRSYLLHLPRFYRENKSNFCLAVEKVVEFLKTRPNFLAPYDTLKAMLHNENVTVTKKMFKSKELLKYVETNIKVPYRYIYPDATEAEYALKNKHEKTIMVMQLRDPQIDTSSLWLKDDQEAEEESSGVSRVSQRLFNVPLTRQVYWEVEKSGERGISQSELSKVMNLTKLQCRALMKNLQNLRIVRMYTADQGRQRMMRYILPKYYMDINEQLASQAEVNSGDELVTGDCEDTFDDVPIPKENLYHHLLHNVSEYSEEISVSIEEMDRMQRSAHKQPENAKRLISVKVLQRMELLEKMVEKHLIFTDLHHMVSIVVERERRRGQRERVCRKTLEKILTTLRNEGRINIYKVTLKSKDFVKVLWFTCHRSLDRDHPMVHEAISRAKSQMLLQKMRRDSVRLEANVGEGRQRVSLKGSNIPKFVRLRLLHEFLFYLVHELPVGSELLNKEEVLNEWRETYPFANVDIPDEMPEIYSREYDWRMFIPPLGRYKGFPRGWVNFQDILMRFPLTLIIKMFPNTLQDPTIEEYLVHPIRKNYLLNQLPEGIRLKLMQFRVYTTYIHDFMKKLCYMGLLQLGHPVTQSLVTMFMYVNRNASVIDTSFSAPGYLHVEDKKYPMTIYHFRTLNDVDKYWDELMTVCFATRLGYRRTIEGREITVEYVHSKPGMVATLTPRQPLEALERDTGDIPGDHLGAGGLDTVFHAHLKSSWKGKTKRKIKMEVAMTKSKLQPVVVPKMKKISSLTRRRPSVISYKAMVRERRVPKTKYTRKITRKKEPERERTVNYDDIDKKAISMMKTLRVTWSDEEDNVLMLCRIATLYLTGKTKKQYVSGHTIRDILHFRLNSVRMTSKACTRRIMYMMKSPATKTNVESCLCEVKQNEMINRRYGENFLEKLKTFYHDEELLSALKHHFINLFIILNGMFYRLSSQRLTSVSRAIPDTLEEFWGKFRETNPVKSPLRYSDPLTNDQIVLGTIYLLFHSSMCTAKDKSPYNLQLFEVYKNYPNEVLASAMEAIRNDQLITCWKSASRTKSKKVVPLQTGPFHLSQLYQLQMLQHLPYGVYQEMQGLHRNRGSRCELTESVTGVCFLFAELLGEKNVEITFELPKKLLVFSNSAPLDTPYERISSRFHSIMSNMPSMEIDNLAQQKSHKKVAFAPDSETFVFRQFAIERWMKLQSPQSHVFCFLRHMKVAEDVPEATFDDICSFNCLFQADLCVENQQDFVECIDDITQGDIGDLEKSLETFLEVTEKLDRRDVKDFGKTKCRRMTIKLVEVLRDLIEEASEDLSKWLAQFYQSDGEEDAEDSIPNTWQIRQDLGANSNIDDFSEKSKRFDNYLTLKEVKLHYEIKTAAPGLMDDVVRERILERVRKRSILRNPTKSIDQILSSFEGSAKSARRVLDAIIECQEFGASLAALERQFGNGPLLMQILMRFLEEEIVAAMGIVEYSFVFWKYANPWVVKSFNVTRLEREAQEPSTSKVMHVGGPDEPPRKRARISKRTASITIRSEEELKNPPRHKEREIFFLRPYPWIRVNGTLNRRVLDKWMGVVLIYLSKNPGITIRNLAERFSYLHPTQLKCLTEVLEEIQCVRIYTLKVPKCSLRSTYQTPETENSHKLAPFDRTIVEILPDAFTRFTGFIGERKYTSDFI